MTTLGDTMTDNWQRPVLIVGAGRSGTNLLAMALGTVPEFKNVYEQRYVWTKGMSDRRFDARAPAEATPATQLYIRKRFQSLSNSCRIIDKTPSNSLRLAFCRRVFPQSQIIHIVRNPLDNIASRMHEMRLIGAQDEPHSVDASKSMRPENRSRIQILASRIQHARALLARGNIPPDQIPAAIVDQLSETLRIAINGKATRWGERVPGTELIAKTMGVEIALAQQWLQCTSAVKLDAKDIDEENFLELRYEDIVLDPTKAGHAVCKFLGIDQTSDLIDYLKSNARSDTVNGAHNRLSKSQIQRINYYFDTHHICTDRRLAG